MACILSIAEMHYCSTLTVTRKKQKTKGQLVKIREQNVCMQTWKRVKGLVGKKAYEIALSIHF